MMKSVLTLTAVSALFLTSPVLADWPQWRGPNRDGHAAEQALLKNWPDEGPKVAWEYDQAGVGYSSLAVADGKVYTMGDLDGQCQLICVDAETGKKVWNSPFAKQGSKDDYLQGWGGGPRSTPTVDGDQVFVLSDLGVLAAFKTSGGEALWKVDLVGQYGGGIPKWGYSESPLVDGNRVVVTPGGKNFMVAFDRKSGKKVWGSRGIDEPAQYVSVMKGKIGKIPFYVTATKVGVIAVNTKTGQELFRQPGTGNDVAVIPTPVLDGDFIYHTSDYGAGCQLIKLSPSASGVSQQAYHLDGKTMMNHHGGVVLIDGVIYGFSKSDGGVWMAQEMESGEVLWKEKIRPNKSGSIAAADGLLYCYNDTDGSVHLAVPNRDRWKPVGKLKLPRQTNIERDRGAIWAHPVISDGKLFIRDQDLIFAFDIGR